MKRRISLIITTLLMALVAPSVHADEIVGEQFRATHPEIWSAGILIDDSAMLKKQWASLQAFTGEGDFNTGKVTSVTNCASYPSDGCEEDKHLNFRALLPYCEPTSPINCISSLVATGPDGQQHKATFVEEFPGPAKYPFSGNPSAGLPASGSNFIVSIPDLPHAHGDKYLVASEMMGQKPGDARTFHINTFHTGIFAVTVIDGNYEVPFSSSRVTDYAFMGMTAGDSSGWDKDNNVMPKCAQMTTTRCALAWPLPLDVNFELSLRMQIPIKGWLHGRLNNASASITSENNGIQNVRIAGQPVVVPIVYKTFPHEELPAPVKKFYANDTNFELMGFRFGTPTGEISIIKSLDQYAKREFPAALVWYQAIADTAPYAATAWSFRSIEDGEIGQRCQETSKGLIGLVSTNSNMYVAEPPYFNKADQSLDYLVTSPHFLPDGSVFKGNYNLVIRSDFARCIYGFSKAPISAKVSILSASGVEQIATTTLGESGGWLRLSSSNFTFSAPTIKVRLSQKNSSNRRSILTCQKGSLKREIAAAQCPKGFRKVA